MANTVFSDQLQTPIIASWLNDVNNLVYNGALPAGLTIAIANGGTGANTVPGALTNLGIAIGTNIEAWSASLDALAALSSTGIVVQTGTNTFAERTIIGGSGITVTNGSGVGGNITISSAGSTPTSLTLDGITSGSLTITTSPIAGSSALALETAGNGTSVMTFPAATDTVACIGQNNAWGAAQIFPAAGIQLTGSSTGTTTFSSSNAGASNFTVTFPGSTGTLSLTNLAQTWTAVQTHSLGDFALLGSSTGKTTLNSGLAGGSNNTLTLPATASDTLAGLGTTQTWTAAQSFTSSDFLLKGSSSGTTTLNAAAVAGSTTLTLQGTTGTIYSTGGTKVSVTDGGTGQGSGYTAYSPILAGTTSTGAFQDSGTLGASGTILTSNGPGIAPTWQAGSGGISLAGNNTWTGVQKFTNAKLALIGTSTGFTTLESSLTSTSSNTLTLPITATDTLAGLGTAQSWTAAQTFSSGDFLLAGSVTGATTLVPASTASGTLTLPAVTDTIAVVGTPQTWTADQTFTPNNFFLEGTSTGSTAINSGLTGAGNNTLILPTTSSDTLAGLGTVQTWTAVQTVTKGDLALLGTSTGVTTLNSGLVSTGNNTLTLPITSTDTLAGLGTAQTWTAVQTFTNSDIKLLGSSTGSTTLTSANSGGSNFTLTLPAVTDTLSVLNTAQTYGAAQTFPENDLLLKGSSTGATTLNSGLSGSGSNTLVLPITSSDTLAGLGTTQTWTAAQTFTNSDIKLLGSSTGSTTLTSSNSGASNFTLTLPAVTDTLSVLNTAQTYGAAQTFPTNDLILKGSSTGVTTLNSGLSGAGNNTLGLPITSSDTLAALGTTQTWVAAQTFTDGDLLLKGSSSGATTLHANATGTISITMPSSSGTLALAGAPSGAGLGTSYLVSTAQFI